MAIRAVVTGMGAISPLGHNVDQLWQGVLEGRSGVGPVTRFDTEAYSTRIAGEVKDFDPLQFMDAKELRRTDLAQQYAIAASQMAIDDSGLDLEAIDHDMAGVVIGSGVGGISTF